jgi:hypothetical protein
MICDRVTRQTTARAHAALNLDADGQPLNYRRAMAGPNTLHWIIAEEEELARLIDSGTMKAMHPHEQPSDRRADTTYYNPQTKEKQNANGDTTYRIRGTIGGDRINYPGKTTARTADMSLVKLLLQSVVSENKNWMTLDIKDFYLGTPLERPEYIRIGMKFISAVTTTKYNLSSFVHNDSILFEVNKGMYGLPQAGLLAQDRLVEHLANYGYNQTQTPCFFRHATNGTDFSLVVDDFGVKYTTRAGALHLIDALEKLYVLKIDWTGAKYLGFTIEFDNKARTVSLSMPGYISKLLERFPTFVRRGADSPSVYTPPTYGATTQAPTAQDHSRALSPVETKEIQEIVGCILYYARAVDLTLLYSVNALGSAQSKPTQQTKDAAIRLLSYCARYPNNKLVYHACDMVLYIQVDASYLSRPNARSVAGGIFYLGNHNKPEEINGLVHAFSTIIPAVMASVAEAEYGGLFLGGQDGEGIRNELTSIGYPQDATLMLCDNKCAVGISSDTIKPKRTKSIDMRFHWIRDRIRQGHFRVSWRKGENNLADFFTKALPVHTHKSLMPLIVFTPPVQNTTHTTRHAQRSVKWDNLNNSDKSANK